MEELVAELVVVVPQEVLVSPFSRWNLLFLKKIRLNSLHEFIFFSYISGSPGGGGFGGQGGAGGGYGGGGGGGRGGGGAPGAPGKLTKSVTP